MSESLPKIRRSVYFWEDHTSKNLKESVVGRKGLSLFELKDMDIPIPDFFVVSSFVYDKIIAESLLRDSEKLLENGRNPDESEVLKSFLKTDFDDETIESILASYTRISGFTDAWVSVRSSVVYPSSPDVSFSGIFSTELNVRGGKNLLDSIKRIYSSMFTDSAVAYASSKGINLTDVKLAVVVQKMVQAEVSGVSFTQDPITQDSSKLSIEAVFGLGDTIALGELTPDTYLLNKKDLSILDKRISPQEWMKIRLLNKSTGQNNFEKIRISSNWNHRQKIEDKYLMEISKVSLIVENKLRQPQVIEWVMAGGKIWVLQSKDLYEKSREEKIQIEDINKFDTLGEVLKWCREKYVGIGVLEDKAVLQAQRIIQNNKHEGNTLTEKLINIAKKSSDKRDDQIKMDSVKREDLRITGLGASFGVVVGNIVHVKEGSDIAVSKKSILVIKEYSSDMKSLIVNSGGVILESGGLTSDSAIMCREFDIPAIVGAKDASSVLKEGDTVRLDGNTGSVYTEKEIDTTSSNVQHPVIESYKEGNLSGIDFLKNETAEMKGVKVDDSVVKIPHDMNLPPCATKVFLNPIFPKEELVDVVGNSHGLVHVDLDKIMIENGRHPLAYVEDKKFVEYSKEIAEKICEYVELAEGNEVILSLGSSKIWDFRALTKGKQFEDESLDDSSHGLVHYLKNKELLSRVLKIVRRVRNVYKKRNVNIGIYSPMNEFSMMDFKKSLLAAGLRRTATFKLYAILDNPTEIILSDEIIHAKIDGVVLDMPRIVRVMQGFGIDETDARYNLGTNSVFKIVDTVFDISKHPSKEIIVMVEDNKDLTKYCVQKGVYGVSVLPKSVKDIRKLVSEQEAKLILGKK
ncbi:MAG: phosphoenolpyruvate synthase, pyruvate, water dikinase [candidate division WS6 bacterium GW2011_GWC1_33_20]|uniref:Phosphoenolpyruvate synthase n=1 Tax=candidate division WS6 bacterium GW2011_GWC1_33_20 TaxID=1619089 RepID=A0A0F9ZJN7_9BACT|nr:MAG: phosphoenolpyruvate synthase, pyruvate, water dikinase [candidate division WS6 bacterium GW2011_GWE2_33_157]KKP44113.1 MAG: phosphoenolpyruvate synthase, pyruvate, water dikinase [candidate division WS6 bacterium GW2011_GWF1_33_233]KKP44428.1 MAG: phosphoenolpyruvate synthase, pyruvate, water dikinase [candidate division WS6 bacterium GW2011_GWC1_33_20]KKP53288.1 MAG: phosphoenolpyruvate synthase, pyruvate, water dikinase [candidate division WS6 bacterium GW2011_WS6_33_547]KKP55939.1 MA